MRIKDKEDLKKGAYATIKILDTISDDIYEIWGDSAIKDSQILKNNIYISTIHYDGEMMKNSTYIGRMFIARLLMKT